MLSYQCSCLPLVEGSSSLHKSSHKGQLIAPGSRWGSLWRRALRLCSMWVRVRWHLVTGQARPHLGRSTPHFGFQSREPGHSASALSPSPIGPPIFATHPADGADDGHAQCHRGRSVWAGLDRGRWCNNMGKPFYTEWFYTPAVSNSSFFNFQLIQLGVAWSLTAAGRVCRREGANSLESKPHFRKATQGLEVAYRGRQWLR